jgi:exonuclease SbcD
VAALAGFTHVVISSGNHDSAIRLGALSGLLTERVHIRTHVDVVGQPVVLTDEHGEVLVYPVPYLDPEATRHVLGGSEPLERRHAAVLGAALDRVRADLATRAAGPGALPRSVVMAHAFVAGRGGEAQVSDSERDLRVGGEELVPTDVFAGITYSALGHLHGPQEPRAPGPGVIRYSGSPLRYSFSEAGHVKSVTLVELDAQGVAEVRLVAVPQPREMALVRGSLAALVADPAHGAAEACWVRAVVTDDVRPNGMFEALRGRFPHLLTAHHVPQRTGTITAAPADGQGDPLDVLARFLADAAGAEDPILEHLQLLRDHYELQQREEEGVA